MVILNRMKNYYRNCIGNVIARDSQWYKYECIVRREEGKRYITKEVCLSDCETSGCVKLNCGLICPGKILPPVQALLACLAFNPLACTCKGNIFLKYCFNHFYLSEKTV